MASALICGRVYTGTPEGLEALRVELEAQARDGFAITTVAGEEAPIPSDFPTDAELDSLLRIVAVAKQRSGQSGRCASFLLAWWNAGAHGGFPLTDLWGMDTSLRLDMCRVFCMVARLNAYPEGNPRLPDLRNDLEQIMAIWRAPKRKRTRKAAP